MPYWPVAWRSTQVPRVGVAGWFVVSDVRSRDSTVQHASRTPGTCASRYRFSGLSGPPADDPSKIPYSDMLPGGLEVNPGAAGRCCRVVRGK